MEGEKTSATILLLFQFQITASHRGGPRSRGDVKKVETPAACTDHRARLSAEGRQSAESCLESPLCDSSDTHSGKVGRLEVVGSPFTAVETFSEGVWDCHSLGQALIKGTREPGRGGQC